MIEIRGVEKLAALSKALKEAGDKGLQRELATAINRAMKPVREAAKRSALDTLPAGGGLNRRVAGSRFRTVRRASSRAVGVRLTAANAYRLGELDKGRVRHPVFGDRDTWVTQQVAPGWWTNPTEAAAADVRKAIEGAMDEVARKLSRL